MIKSRKKLYRTKNTLFYVEPTIVSRLMQLYYAHGEKYRQLPRVIYMTKKEWKDYEEEVCRNPHIRHEYASRGYPRIKHKGAWVPCLSFRGVPVIAIDE